ncbi:unnamed protein product [Clonostachys rosea f. rosea IK726]|uniref:Uncharacterized protein n=1 Tax=Clonostachys rosea f. rosea IK726 TaxID=1349383 RepID=A0ACA9UHQ7_BIOOC|nr:unnamed protein product [Clonostachys rosea f. rosea IK726]
MDNKEIPTENTGSVDAKTSNVPVQVTGTAILDTPKQSTTTKSKRKASVKDYLRIFTYAEKTDVYLIIVGTLASMAAGAVSGRLVETFNDYATPGKTQDRVSFDGLLNRYAGCGRYDYSNSECATIGISEKLGTLVQFLATILAAIIVAFTYSWSLTLVTGSLLVFVAIVGVVLVPFMTKKHQKTFEAEQMASSIANEAFGSIRMIMAYSAQARVGERFSKWANEAKKHGQGVAPIVALQFGLIFFGVYATFGLAFWFGTKSFREGR